jgi:hypothetical protein
MPHNRLAAGVAVLKRRMRQHAGVAITYTRGERTLNIVATPGRTAFVSNMQNKARVEWGDADYLIDVALLAELGEPEEPARPLTVQ